MGVFISRLKLDPMGPAPSRLARFVAQQTIEAFLSSVIASARPLTADARAPGDFQNQKPLGGIKHDLGALDMFEGERTIAGDRFELMAVFGGENDADSLGHKSRLASQAKFVKPIQRPCALDVAAPAALQRIQAAQGRPFAGSPVIAVARRNRF